MNQMLSFAKDLRKNLTTTEEILWYHLRAKRFYVFKFYRQKPIAQYIVDFVCFEPRVIIECDGGQHALENVKDMKRDNFFYRTRFSNIEILEQ